MFLKRIPTQLTHETLLMIQFRWRAFYGLVPFIFFRFFIVSAVSQFFLLLFSHSSKQEKKTIKTMLEAIIILMILTPILFYRFLSFISI